MVCTCVGLVAGTVLVAGCVVSARARGGVLVKGLLTEVGCSTIFGVDVGIGALMLGVVIADVVTASVGTGIAAGVDGAVFGELLVTAVPCPVVTLLVCDGALGGTVT